MLSVIGIAAAVTSLASPASAAASPPVYVFGIPVEFILFALTLLGVAVFHHKTLQVALAGLAGIVLYKLIFTGFKTGVGPTGLALHMQHEAMVLSSLFLLLMGFALLSRHIENSRLPDEVPALPSDVFLAGWPGAARNCLGAFGVHRQHRRGVDRRCGGQARLVHIGYLAGIVAASNAGGSGGVIGDTTTTMMWLSPARSTSS